ncbi:hypothetical protein ANCDUO_02561 [Ancylostoma duodenale]|uniref:NUP210 Ig-like domain-containing protein n=1 Tax=Ancylostoma duodenale TaxID=51022 RepID=A0A0C2H023_9BILA|nr:hypothetical protein ANCDUO_02561 [Ancylostoma duodenale]
MATILIKHLQQIKHSPCHKILESRTKMQTPNNYKGRSYSVSAYVSGLGIAGSAMITVELSAKNRFRNRLKANLELRLVKPAFAEPHKLVLWNEVEAVGIVRLGHGSGHFTVHELPGAPFTASVKDNTIMVTPKSQGGGSLRIEDVCINGDPLDIPVKITDIHALVIYGLHSMEVGSVAEVSVDAVDEAGNSFSRAHGAYTGAVLESSDRSVLISNVSITLLTQSREYSATVHSEKIKIPPLNNPEDSQLEVVGGPQPTLPIQFALNNSKIASVEPNALITSNKLGYTSITGTVDIGDGHSSQSTVLLRVVSLAGIRAVASTHITERGAQVWVRVSGLDENESPFSFGGALYPFKVTWTVSHPGVLQVIHPFGSSISEADNNRFAVWLEGCSPGSATVKDFVKKSDYPVGGLPAVRLTFRGVQLLAAIVARTHHVSDPPNLTSPGVSGSVPDLRLLV